MPWNQIKPNKPNLYFGILLNLQLITRFINIDYLHCTQHNSNFVSSMQWPDVHAKYYVWFFNCAHIQIFLKVRLEEHRNAVVRGEIEKSGMADHIWKEKGNLLPLWDKVEIIDKHWRIRRLKKSAHMLGYNDLPSRPSIELNTIWEPIIKKARWEKKMLNIAWRTSVNLYLPNVSDSSISLWFLDKTVS